MKYFRLGRKLEDQPTTFVFAGVVGVVDVHEAVKITQGTRVVDKVDTDWWRVDPVTRRWCKDGRSVDRTNVGYDPFQAWVTRPEKTLTLMESACLLATLRDTQEGDILQPCNEDGEPLPSAASVAYVVHSTSIPLVVFGDGVNIEEYTET